MSIVNLTQSDFREKVTESSLPVLVDFWASWCKPCLAIAPTLEEIARDYEGKLVVAKVNVDEQRLLASMFQVMSIPTLILFKDGKKVAELVGTQSKESLIRKIDQYC